MNGETNLQKMLASMSPVLLAGEYVFCTLPNALYGEHADLQPIATMREEEGLTLVILKQHADAMKWTYSATFRCISLRLHSSLEAVGLTAAFSNQLSEAGISANVIAGYFHDHIFVQTKLADRALAVLTELTVT